MSGHQPNPFEQPGKPAGAGPSDQPSSPYGQPSQGSPYGQPAQPSQASPYGQPAQPSQASPYGQPAQPSQASPYGQPSAQPPVYGQPAPAPQYGAPPQYGYGSPAPGLGGGAYGAPQPWGPAPLAAWGDRVVAYLWDLLLQLPGLILYFVSFFLLAAGTPTKSASGRVISEGNSGLAIFGGLLLVLAWLYILGVGIWNTVLRQGRTGESWGKSKVGIRVVSMRDGQLIGVGNNFLRQLCHIADGVAYVGYLWPLWDQLKQTFADKIMSTVVIKTR
ncbi:MAG TPA: RDD family protein [Dermatophilaceae bacterium]|nr:RDD family protein [Dermatophilaceae bacterium]